MAEAPKSTHRDPEFKEDLLKRMRRIEGQVRGVTRMIEEDVYCDNVLHQVSAIRAALDALGKQVLESHLRGCLVERIQTGDQSAVDEMLTTVKTLLK